jgi:DNA replication protein DnaC
MQRKRDKKSDLEPISEGIRQMQADILRMRDDPEAQRRNLEAQASEARREILAKQTKIEQAKSLSIIGRRFLERTFENLTVTKANQKAVKVARYVAENPSHGVIFYGPYGVAKTHIVAAIAHSCIARGIPAICNTLNTIFLIARGTFVTGSKMTEEQYLSRLATVPVLILDDLGKERLTEWSAQFLWSLINARYEQNLPIIGTCNLSLEAFTQRYSTPIPGLDEHTLPSILDRLNEMVDQWVEIRGESHRVRNKSAPITG